MNKTEDTYINANKRKGPRYRTIVICNANLGKDLIIFPSENAMKEYCKFKGLSEGCEEYNLILRKQYEGLAMPLIGIKFNKTKKFGSKKKLYTIYKLTPVPRDSNRVFDKNIDRYTFCTVYKCSGKKHYKYTFNFQPDPQDLSKNFETYLFYHRKARLGDIPNIGDNVGKFRWILTNRCPKQKYTYSLFLLDADQPSMADNMDMSSMELYPKNELIQTQPRMGKSLHSPNEVATLIHLADNHGTFSIHQTACLRILESYYLKGLESDSIHSLSIEELTFISTSIISKYISEKNTTINNSIKTLNQTYYTLTLVT